MTKGWQIFQDIMVGLACGSQPGIQGLPIAIMYEQQKKEMAQLEEIKQAVQGQKIQDVLPADEEILDVLPADEGE